MIEQAKELVLANDFLQGGLVLGCMTYVVMYIKYIPIFLWKWFKFFSFVTIAFDSRTNMFVSMETWIHLNKVLEKKNRIKVFLNKWKNPPVLEVVPDRQDYFVKLEGVRCHISKTKEEGKEDSQFAQIIENYEITFPRWHRSKMITLLEGIAADHDPNVKENTVPMNTFRWNEWSLIKDLPKRNLDHLIMRKGQKEKILQTIDTFRASEQLYAKRQIPWQLGIMLYGPPGTGKTSLITMLAAHYQMSLNIIDLGDMDKESKLKTAFQELEKDSIIVIEDFDSNFKGRECLIKKSTATFSSLLNGINGAVYSPGRILIITTNKLENTDPALIRPGRIDYTFNLTYCDEHQTRGICDAFDVADPAFVADLVDLEITPAELTSYLHLNKAYDIHEFKDQLEEQKRLIE